MLGPSKIDFENVSLTVDAPDDGKRLDSLLAARFTQYSRSTWVNLIATGQVRIAAVAPSKIKPSLRVKAGAIVSIQLPALEEQYLKPNPDLRVEFLYEDKWILVVNKPTGMPTHPQRIDAVNTLANFLLAQGGPELPCADEDRLKPGIVHRLDADTTGVMVCARNSDALVELKRQFRERKVNKKYLAVVHGIPQQDSFTVDAPLQRDPHRGDAMRVNKAAGRNACTEFRVLDRFEKSCLIEAHPITGRTHQVRVHLASRGHPVIADRLYSTEKEVLLEEEGFIRQQRVLIRRQALHARSLAFTHPDSGKEMTFEAPLPEDLERLLAALRSEC